MEKKLIRGVDMTAFTDVVFLLLIFFLMHSHLGTANELPLDVNLPEVGQSKQKKEKLHEEKSLIVTIAENGTIFIEGEKIAKETLQETLLKVVREKKWKQAILQADKVSSYGYVIDVLDILKKVGLEQVSLAVKQKSI